MKLDLSNPLDVQKFRTYGKTLIESAEQIELRKMKVPKSLSQNNYAHVVLSLFGCGFGYTLDEVKHMMKVGAGFSYEKKGRVFVKSIANMDTVELTKLIDYTRNKAALQGYYIPTSEEYLTNKFNIDKEIEQHKQWL